MLYLVEGRSVVDPEDLEDGMYPGDEGHRRLAAAVAKLLLPHLTDLHDRAEKRWASEGIPATPDVSDIDVPPVVTPPVTATSPATTAAPPDPATDGGADASLRFDQDLDPGDQVAFSEPATLPDRDGRPDMASLEQALLHHPPLNDATVATETGPTTVEDAAAEQCAVDASPIDLDVLDPAPVDVAVPVEPEPVDTAPTHVAGETDLGAPPEGGTPAGDVTTDGGAAPSVVAAEPPPLGDAKTTVRRDMTPVDIEIADMVVAALTLATNGADDVFGHGDPVDELQWGQAVPTYELRWPEGTEPAADEDRQWAEAVATDEFEWADPSATDEFEWADPGAVEELQWAETADPGAY
jgi:hypothetical protein